MTLEKKKKIESVVSWVLAMILCALGVCLSVKSLFGVSMIEAPVCVTHLKLSESLPWFTYGMAEYGLQAILLIAMCIAVRQFKWRYLLSFATAFLFGLIIDGWNLVFAGLFADTLTVRIILAVAGCLITTFSVALFFRTTLPLQVWELFVKEIADKYKLKITNVKWVYDICSLAAAVILMFIFFGEFRTDAIYAGTVITTFINAPLIGRWSSLLDNISKKLIK